jgi:hypothetical protein
MDLRPKYFPILAEAFRARYREVAEATFDRDLAFSGFPRVWRRSSRRLPATTLMRIFGSRVMVWIRECFLLQVI